MRFATPHFCRVIFFVLLPLCVSGSSLVFGSELPDGVKPLLLTDGKPLSSFVPEGTLFLNDPETLDKFLKKLEGSPPDWKFLFGSNVDERYDRLFDETEKRDAARIGNATANQTLAFLWEGDLTSYRPEHKGFGVAIGPSQIPTAWGIIRFKIANQPSEMVAIPPSSLLEVLQNKRLHHEQVGITILFIGKLIPEESLMYDFSTVKEGEGMILPIVNLTQIEYLLE